jgi:hypothetical protein
LVFKTGVNIGLPCNRYCHEGKKTIKESKVEIFNDNHEYKQPERYGRSPQYGRQINVEENV